MQVNPAINYTLDTTITFTIALKGERTLNIRNM